MLEGRLIRVVDHEGHDGEGENLRWGDREVLVVVVAIIAHARVPVLSICDRGETEHGLGAILGDVDLEWDWAVGVVAVSADVLAVQLEPEDSALTLGPARFDHDVGENLLREEVHARRCAHVFRTHDEREDEQLIVPAAVGDYEGVKDNTGLAKLLLEYRGVHGLEEGAADETDDEPTALGVVVESAKASDEGLHEGVDLEGVSV